MLNNRDTLGITNNDKQADLLHYNSCRGEWWELFLTNDSGQQVHYIHRLFWKGSGYLHKHVHIEFNERIEVLEGRCAYIIDDIMYKASKGDIIHIPAGTPHVNPYNIGIEPLVLLQNNPAEKLVSFFRYYYEAVEKESFARNERALPTVKQMKSMNKLFSDTILFVNISKVEKWMNLIRKVFKKISIRKIHLGYIPKFS